MAEPVWVQHFTSAITSTACPAATPLRPPTWAALTPRPTASARSRRPAPPLPRPRIPAVVQVDGTARLQTVRATEHPLFHRLLAHFDELTGVPLLLNTSFNRQAPIVETPEHAIEAYRRMGLDALVLGN